MIMQVIIEWLATHSDEIDREANAHDLSSETFVVKMLEDVLDAYKHGRHLPEAA